MTTLSTLSVEDVLRIHEILVADFAKANDPISPAGLRDLGLLESAVGRQHTGGGGKLKYETPAQSAATLMYGVCNNHAFHNGNKRTALVSMLVHLDQNGLTLQDTNQKELFKLILAVANHDLAVPKRGRQSPDAEVEAIANWIKRRAVKPQRGERQITFRELRRRLGHFQYELTHAGKGNAADVYKIVEEKRFLRSPREVRKRIGTIGYRDEGTFVSMKDLKLVRRICKLTEEDGVDSGTFYDSQAIVDGFINKYRNVLRRLSTR
ncbi:type II toxin-antitoxin system death-on-curing family toxin [Candidatus Nitrospira nitrificans]|uniref:Death-on-curing family protein n=1 Tax=Candidatus Nitrospira nitrificans TaxID=1742973 RepID=A0A0S4LL38_9BACT|nr:type II toxin-antitoxin system death-on-curing family toxin [Candidatus Nitrospira nitrificans]CUS37673.1 Death-on-curing family protein [Candidatus Nitrospira nitrificans]